MGYRVDVKHRRSVAPGERLRIRVRIFEFDWRRALVYMRAETMGGELVGEGINERFVQNIE